MGFLFLFLGYMGVPVAFALIASVLVVTIFTPVSQASMIAQVFNGMDVEALLAVPFFLLVGDLMTSANVTLRMIRLSQTMVGHFRGGLAQVVTLFSMFFAGISGSSAADVAVLTRTLAPEMKREGYDRAFITTLAFGLITPPYGLCLLMASKFVGIKFSKAMLASLPIYIVFFVAITFTIYFPDVVLWLPKHLLPVSVGCFPNPNGSGYICP